MPPPDPRNSYADSSEEASARAEQVTAIFLIKTVRFGDVGPFPGEVLLRMIIAAMSLSVPVDLSVLPPRKVRS